MRASVFYPTSVIDVFWIVFSLCCLNKSLCYCRAEAKCRPRFCKTYRILPLSLSLIWNTGVVTCLMIKASWEYSLACIVHWVHWRRGPCWCKSRALPAWATTLLGEALLYNRAIHIIVVMIVLVIAVSITKKGMSWVGMQHKLIIGDLFN